MTGWERFDGAADPMGSLAEAFAEHNNRLARIVRFRLDNRVVGRIDVADVLQESYLNASKRIVDAAQSPRGTFFIWLRTLVEQTVIDFHRRHVVAECRSVLRELPYYERADSTSASLQMALLAKQRSPSSAAIAAERIKQVDQLLGGLSATDREVLALRHFEQLTNREVAEILGITERNASVRYFRAIGKIRHLLADGT